MRRYVPWGELACGLGRKPGGRCCGVVISASGYFPEAPQRRECWTDWFPSFVQPDTVTGDIVFVLQLKEHPKFKRKVDDLFVEHSLSLTEALCGFQFPLTHLDGRQLLIKSAPGEIVKPGVLCAAVCAGRLGLGGFEEFLFPEAGWFGVESSRCGVRGGRAGSVG
jgi:hypothetical protein